MSARTLRTTATLLALWLALAGTPSAAALQEDAPPPPQIGAGPLPESLPPESARAARERAVAWMLEHQNEDGSWAVGVLDGMLEYGFSIETYYAWQVASHALVVMALQEAGPSPEVDAALARGIDWLCSTRMPKRGSDWDVDYVWSGLYGVVATTRLAKDPRFADGERAGRIDARGREFAALLVHNEVPTGGWAYYDDPPFTQRPKWATSFCTALVLPAVQDAVELGWIADAEVLERARRAVRRAASPSGAFAYNANEAIPRYRGGEHIDDVKGSLGRIQVCHFGLASTGDERITPDRIRWGLEQFFEHHRFLRVAHGRPVPHEAYYYNAAYFYLFGHYYASQAIEMLPDAAERESWHARLRPYLIEAQAASGSSVDFLVSEYMRAAGTAYVALALSAGLPDPTE